MTVVVWAPEGKSVQDFRMDLALEAHTTTLGIIGRNILGRLALADWGVAGSAVLLFLTSFITWKLVILSLKDHIGVS
jgi:hypothetical protein